MLWFDVGIKRYTTLYRQINVMGELWFDVGIKRYTTVEEEAAQADSCGLM